MILRPQQKRTKEHKKLMGPIAKGDSSDEWRSVGRVTKVAEAGQEPTALNDTTEVAIKRDLVAPHRRKHQKALLLSPKERRVKPLSLWKAHHAGRRLVPSACFTRNLSQPVW